jgi:hypothetical protein
LSYADTWPAIEWQEVPSWTEIVLGQPSFGFELQSVETINAGEAVKIVGMVSDNVLEDALVRLCSDIRSKEYRSNRFMGERKYTYTFGNKYRRLPIFAATTR